MNEKTLCMKHCAVDLGLKRKPEIILKWLRSRFVALTLKIKDILFQPTKGHLTGVMLSRATVYHTSFFFLAQRGAAETPSSLVINEMENASKLNKLLVEGGSEALTRVFNTFHPPENLQDDLIANKSTLQELLDGNILNERQWDRLFPPNGDAPDAGTFDFTLLFFLLNTICDLPPPSSDECNKPPQRYTSLVKSIHNLRRLHDKLYASKSRIDTPTFNDLWDNISSILVTLGLKPSELDRLIKPYEEEKKAPPLSSGRWNSGEMESICQRLKAVEEALKYIQERDNHNAKDFLPTTG